MSKAKGSQIEIFLSNSSKLFKAKKNCDENKIQLKILAMCNRAIGVARGAKGAMAP